MSKVMQPAKTWGLEAVDLSPFYFNSLRLKYALAALEGVSGRLLEVGSGAGAFVRAIKLQRPDLEIIGSDIDSKLVKLAQKLDNEGDYKQADVNKLPFKDRSFEAVVAFDVIEHLESPGRAFSEINRVLKRGGVFHAAIPLEGYLFTLHGLLLKLGIKPKEKYAGHIQQFSLADIKDIFKQSGFSNLQWTYSGHCIYQLIDFSYFSLLSLLGKQVSHTVEGYEVAMPKGLNKQLLVSIRMLLASLFYGESKILSRFPGVIGHFTANN